MLGRAHQRSAWRRLNCMWEFHNPRKECVRQGTASQTQQSGSFDCHQSIIRQQQKWKTLSIEKHFINILMIIAILHAHQTCPSRMQSNVLISRVKTRVITCICEGQSWWVCMMTWLTLDCSLNICVAFGRVKFYCNSIIPMFLKLTTKSF